MQAITSTSLRTVRTFCSLLDPRTQVRKMVPGARAEKPVSMRVAEMTYGVCALFLYICGKSAQNILNDFIPRTMRTFRAFIYAR